MQLDLFLEIHPAQMEIKHVLSSHTLDTTTVHAESPVTEDET